MSAVTMAVLAAATVASVYGLAVTTVVVVGKTAWRMEATVAVYGAVTKTL